MRSATNAVVVTDRKEAQAIFELLGESREREVLSLNAQGRVREYQLRCASPSASSTPRASS